MEDLIKNLPEPNLKIEYGNASLEIYEAKTLYNQKWNNLVLKRITEKARKSYYKYGGARELLDKYDKKAAIYLCRAVYFHNSKQIEEWLSVRMVPGDGYFSGVGEIELYNDNGQPLVNLLCDKLDCNIDQLWSYIYSDSRMCGIPPYVVTKNKIIPNPAKRRRFTPICFALMQIQFMCDYPDTNFKYVSAIINPHILNNVVSFKLNNKIIGPYFEPAEKILKLPSNSNIQIDRNIYSYKYPTYWLDTQELNSLIKNLIKKNKITKNTLEYYFKTSKLESVFGNADISKMLTEEGKIYGSKLTGNELRKLVDKYVSDLPSLKITPIYKWRKSFIYLLNEANIDIMNIRPELSKFSI